MKNEKFPLNYLKSIGAPLKAFQNRNKLNWLQIILVFIFISLLIAIPVFTHYQRIDLYSIEDFYPNAVEMMDDEVIQALHKAEFSSGEMRMEESFIIEKEQGIIASGESLDEIPAIKRAENVLLFDRHEFIIRDETGAEKSVNYTDDFSLKGKTRDEIIVEFSKQYTNQYHNQISFSFTVVLYLFILLLLFFIVFIYAYLLKMMEDFTMSDIVTYKEAVNLILNLIALPTLVAVLYGFFRFNVIIMLGIQVVGLILMLVQLFKQTQFQEVKTS